MTVLLTLTFVAFILAAVGGTTLAAVAIAAWAFEEAGWLLDERRGSRMLDDADVAHRDALLLSVLASELEERDRVYVPESWTPISYEGEQ